MRLFSRPMLWLVILIALAGCGGPPPTPTSPAPAPPTTMVSPPLPTATLAAAPADGTALLDSPAPPAPVTPSVSAPPTPQPSAFAPPMATAPGAGPAPPVTTTSVPTPVAGWEAIPATNAGPAPRYDHTALLDPVRQRLVIFGGRDPQALGDTWLFDLATRTWRQVPAAGPPARFGHGVVYDAAHRRMLLVMGQGAGFYNDAWAFDLDAETWTELTASQTGPDQPRPRYGQSAALDGQGRVFISHGFSDQGRFDDTWLFDPATARWSKLTPATDVRPLKRCLHDLVYDALAERMILYGGCSSGFGPCPQGDLWAFALRTQTWQELPAAGAAPAPRSNPALGQDLTGRRLMVFGGLTGAGPSAETWIYDLSTTTWHRLDTPGGPVPRSSAGRAADPATGRLWIVGGKTAQGPVMDLWAWQDFVK